LPSPTIAALTESVLPELLVAKTTLMPFAGAAGVVALKFTVSPQARPVGPIVPTVMT
jgi:hypothetical protein